MLFCLVHIGDHRTSRSEGISRVLRMRMRASSLASYTPNRHVNQTLDTVALIGFMSTTLLFNSSKLSDSRSVADDVDEC